MKTKVLLTGWLLAVSAALCMTLEPDDLPPPKKASAGKALAEWHRARAWPMDRIHMAPYSEAFRATRLETPMARTTAFPGTWEAIGPMNFGGRLLCMAFNPQNPSTLLVGSASGGLWRSYSGGAGAFAWEQVATGFPVIGVGALAWHPADSNIIYLGTGEVYNYQNTGTGVSIRTTRGTYGIGILKSADGGATWTSSLNWQYDDLRGVQDIVINPLNPNTVFAATTEGTYRSLDAGGTWSQVHAVTMATDIEMHAADTTLVFLAVGNSNSPGNGIYKSVDGGASFSKISNGLPSFYTGKALISIAPSQPSIMYASIAQQLLQVGFFKSFDYGDSWTMVSSEDVAKYQGWYSHDVAIRPDSPNEILCAGIESWRSFNSGQTLLKKSDWSAWDFSATPIGGPEGPPDYMHADIHGIYYHPTFFDSVYFVTDGGLFVSDDGGETFSGANGRLHCTQFYADFSCSPADSLFAIGGLQDNATPVYEGNLSWRRVIGGDGLSTAIHPANDSIVYASYQYLNINKSTDRAQTFNFVANYPGGSVFCFSGPYVLCPSNTNIMYASSEVVFKSVDGGDTWQNTNNGMALDGNPVLKLAVSPFNEDVVYAATVPYFSNQYGLYQTVDGGSTWNDITGTLPNRYILDIEVDPVNDSIVYLALGGFGTNHLYKSEDMGATWMAAGAGLDDAPANTLFIDPLNNQVVYAGNDLGIFVSLDGGVSFQDFNDGLTDANLVFDISYSPSNRMLRLATHGKGAWERYMLPANVTSVQKPAAVYALELVNTVAYGSLYFTCLPRPAGGILVEVFDMTGKRILGHPAARGGRFSVPVIGLAPGAYLAVCKAGEAIKAFRFLVPASAK